MLSLKLQTLLIVLLPLVSAVFVGLFNKKISERLSALTTAGSILISFVLSVLLFWDWVVLDKAAETVSIYTWATFGNNPIEIGFLIDRLTCLMITVVTFVSLMVHVYTMGYMKDDAGYQRFFSYIAAFTFGMLMLVMAKNFLQLFFGWEAVGLMSYLLIGFWFQKESAIFASLKAFLVNRIGDMGFLLGIAAIYYYFGTLDYQPIFEQASHVPVSALTLICLCLFVGAMGKSAQMPLHVWLPDSMEGPTPISALIHAATMVTAGVFMLARLSPIFEYSDTALNVVLSIGAITCFLTGLLGIVQNDIKRIIAYSTLSQLGYMMTAMGASAYGIGIFHLMTHAFFKALLFLGAGSVILALHHEQNIWKMGGLRKYLPITYATMALGSLALIGFPFFSGYYSKDLIIESVKSSTLSSAVWAYPIVLFSVFITALYTFRLFFVVFHGPERMEDKLKSKLHESPPVIYWPLILLAIPSVLIGMIFVDFLFKNFFQSAIVVQTSHPAMHDLQTHFQGALKMGLQGFVSFSFLFGILGILITWLCYVKFPHWPAKLRHLFGRFYTLLKEKYGFDIFYEKIILRLVRGIAWLCWKVGDQWAIDGMMVQGSANSLGSLAILGRRFQTGYLYHYVFTMIIGFLILIVWLMLG